MRCKLCKSKFLPKVFLQKYCLENSECIEAELSYKKAKQETTRKKEWNKEKKAKMPILYPRKYKNLLQNEINKLARNIDTKLSYLCIDCGLDYGKQADGSHFHNVQGNENIRFNLHNIHKSRSDCNQFHGGRKRLYAEGLEKRYSKKYLEYVDFEMRKQYKTIKLNSIEIAEKLAIVRKLNRDFETFEIGSTKDGIKARNMFNSLIGIYL